MEPLNEEPHYNLCIKENDIIAGAQEIVKLLRPSWPSQNLQHKVFSNGISNKLVGIYLDNKYNEMVLVRVYGNKTDLLIDRQAEIKNIKALHNAGHTYCIYATFVNGLAYEFIEGETLTADSVRDESVFNLVAKRMAEMHLLQIDQGENCIEPIIWNKSEKFLNLIPRKFDDPIKQSRYEKLIKPVSTFVQEYQFLKELLSKSDSPVVFCHNDLLLTNVLHDREKDKVTFIDFEYAGYNYQAFDIANHFAEFAGVEDLDFSRYPNEEFQKKWLRVYLEAYKNSSEIAQKDVDKLYKQVNQFVLLTHFFWTIWALIQSQYSSIDFDFLEYAAVRSDEYFYRKSLMLASKNSIRNV